MKFLAQEWLRSAKDDIIALNELIDNPDITNIVAFHCEQCVQKCFKAIIEQYALKTPRIHSLITLHERVKEISDLRFDMDTLDKLDKLYIDARYPSDLGLLPYGKPTLGNAKEFYNFAIEVYEKTKKFLE
jgi:HEPN domain-containing protein